jgi:hypothetical protein
LDAWLDAETVTRVLVQALSEQNAERTIGRHVLPGLARVHASLHVAKEHVGDAVPASARTQLDALVTNPRGPRFLWLKGALDRDKLRALITPAIQEMLIGFAGKVAPGGKEAVGAAAGVIGMLGRNTGERLLSFGKSVADNLGVDIEGRMREAARDYSQGATAGLQAAIEKRIRSPEASSLIAGLSRGVLEHVLATPMATILDDLDRLPLGDAVKLAAPILEHNLGRELWRNIVESEVRAVLALEGQRTLRELLQEAGLLELLHEKILERGEPVLRQLFASDGFAQWLDRLLKE